MEIIAYVRIGLTRRGPTIEASTKPNHNPIRVGSRAIPTVSFALRFDLPDEAFNRAEQILAAITVPYQSFRINADVELENLDE